MAQGSRRDAEQEHEVADGVAQRQRRAHRIRVQRRENWPEERVPDDDASADDHDQRVDREPEGVAPGGRDPLEHEEGGSHDRVVGDVGEIGRRRGGRAATSQVQPRPRNVANGVGDHRDGEHRPPEANPLGVDVKRGPKDDRCGEHVQTGLADIGNGTS